MEDVDNKSRASIAVIAFGIVLFIVGAFLASGGAYLTYLGGSLYYLLAGLGLIASGILICRGRLLGIWIYSAVFLLTCLWAAIETRLDFWAMVSRTAAPLAMAVVALLLVPLFHSPGPGRRVRKLSVGAGIALALGFVILLVQMTYPHGVLYNEDLAVTPGPVSTAAIATGGEWRDYGRTGRGDRFAPFDQINPGNVHKLEVAWTMRHGDISKLGNENQNTPLYIDGTLYHCSPSDIVTAIDGSTGKIRWQFDPKAQSPLWNRCRSVAYFDPGPNDPCGARILVATIDVRLLAIRARDGQLCETFGHKGTVDLKTGIGPFTPGLYMQTSGAMVAGDKILIGGWVGDNVSRGEASGLVRAFDAKTGALAWAWDLGNPQITKYPPEGQTYTRGTPNVWAPMAYDLDLGMVYLPTGNATPDFLIEHRRPFDNEYASSVVALDLNTGREKWRFQTTHLDQWDYDVPAQPTLIDIPVAGGGMIPALVQLTKRGQIFLLDRRTGKPVAEVAERPVPSGAADGQYLSRTQPYSVGMPAIGAEPLTEARTWGMTPLDQLYCRIQFKRHVYKGDFTPPSLKLSLFSPGNNGGFNWGGASFDPTRNLLIVNDLRMPISTRLMPRPEIDAIPGIDPHGTYSKQFGTRYGFYLVNFMSPLGAPCMQPPYGTVTAIDVVTRRIRWQRPVGTTKETGPFGLPLGIPFDVGMPTLGGSVATKGGVIFFSGTQDYYLRAFSAETGRELWKGALPTGGQATPTVYMDKKTGREMIVVNAGGAPHNPRDRGDYLVAFALPLEAIGR